MLKRTILFITLLSALMLFTACATTTNRTKAKSINPDLPASQVNIPLLGDAQKAYMRSHIICQDSPAVLEEKSRPKAKEKKPTAPVKKNVKKSSKKITQEKAVEGKNDFCKPRWKHGW